MRFTIIIAIFISISGCASKHKKLINLSIGLNKRQILTCFANPINTYRSKGMDHWVYESVKRAKNSSEKLLYIHTLSFENGVLVKKSFKRTFTSKEIKEFKKN